MKQQKLWLQIWLEFNHFEIPDLVGVMYPYWTHKSEWFHSMGLVWNMARVLDEIFGRNITHMNETFSMFRQSPVFVLKIIHSKQTAKSVELAILVWKFVLIPFWFYQMFQSTIQFWSYNMVNFYNISGHLKCIGVLHTSFGRKKVVFQNSNDRISSDNLFGWNQRSIYVFVRQKSARGRSHIIIVKNLGKVRLKIFGTITVFGQIVWYKSALLNWLHFYYFCKFYLVMISLSFFRFVYGMYIHVYLYISNYIPAFEHT